MKIYDEHLIRNGIRPSVQRLKIFEFLHKNHNHPTADNIYEALLPAIPTLSKTTVYNTLNRFVDKGLAVVVNIDEHEARYDANTSAHGHFKCISCGGFFDIHFPEPDIKLPKGFQAENYHLNIKGYCKVCNEKKNR